MIKDILNVCLSVRLLTGTCVSLSSNLAFNLYRHTVHIYKMYYNSPLGQTRSKFTPASPDAPPPARGIDASQTHLLILNNSFQRCKE